MIEVLKNLSEIFGPSGMEERVREYILNEVKDYVDRIEEDLMGNIYIKMGSGPPKVMLCAHMDEVGLIVKGYEGDSYLRFSPIGGIPAEILPGKKVVFENGKKGIIGYKPIHLQKKEEKEVSFEDLVIDTGIENRKELEKTFSPGDYGVFDTEFSRFNGNFLKGKAFDDRVGCTILLEIIKRFEPDFELNVLFSVQEEVGLRGAKIGGERIKPEISVVIEGTAAGDFYQGGKRDFPFLGKGPVLTVLDNSCVVDREILNFFVGVALKNKMPFQYKKPLIGGTDAGMIQIAGKGNKIGIISVPIRYIHSPVSILKEEDLENTFLLLLNFLKGVKNLWRGY